VQGSQSQIQISGYSFSRLELTSVLQIALRGSPINNPPSHSSALSDTRQTPTSKSCFSFHLFEAWQPVDPKTHHPHSDIFSSPRVTRPRIWPPGVKGLAILGLTHPLPQLHALRAFQMQQRAMAYPSYISDVACIHADLPQGLMPISLPGSVLDFCFFYFLCASNFLCLSSLFDP
jgi:hypothetical protein